MLLSLTSLTLPPLRYTVLGLLLAVNGWATPTALPPETAPPYSEVAEEPLATIQEQPTTRYRQLTDGTTILTITWDTVTGDTVEQHSANLVLSAPPVPEPAYPFLGACASCVVLLRRRRMHPGTLRSARVNLATIPLERFTSQCSAVSPPSRLPRPSHRHISRRPPSGRTAMRPRVAA